MSPNCSLHGFVHAHSLLNSFFCIPLDPAWLLAALRDSIDLCVCRVLAGQGTFFTSLTRYHPSRMPLHISCHAPLRPLRMNPPTPSFPSRHFYLAFSGNVGEALGPLCRPYRQPQQQERATSPDWQLSPGTSTIFGSSRQRSKSPEVGEEKEEVLYPGIEPNTSVPILLAKAPRYTTNQCEPETLAKLCGLPPIGRPPQKPLPPLPSSKVVVPKPACHVPWISREQSPSSQTSASFNAKHVWPMTDNHSRLTQPESQLPRGVTAEHTCLSPVTHHPLNEVITSTVSSSPPPLPSSAASSSKLPPSPESPLFRLATKRTPATYENAIRIAASSTIRNSMSSFHGKVRETRASNAENDADCSCLPFRVTVDRVKALWKGKRGRTKRDGEYALKKHSLTMKQQCKMASDEQSASCSDKTKCSNEHTGAKATATAKTTDRHSKRWAEEDLSWQANVTNRFAGEGRWLPISKAAAATTNRTDTAAIRQGSSTTKPKTGSYNSHNLTKHSAILHKRAASTRAQTLKRNRTSAYNSRMKSTDEQSTLLRNIDHMAQTQLRWDESGNRGVKMEKEYAVERWKARRRSEYRGVERCEALGWEGIMRACVW